MDTDEATHALNKYVKNKEMDILDILIKIPDTEDKKTLDLFSSMTEIKKKGFLNKENALKILKWKSPRPLRNYESNSDEDFIEITKLAFDTNNEKLKIHILTFLKGVSFPAASAILMFFDKTNYPIIDIRVWKELYNFGLVTINERGQGFTLEQWWTYLKVIRKLANETGLTARQVEKRLFDNNKINQNGNLYNQSKKYTVENGVNRKISVR